LAQCQRITESVSQSVYFRPLISYPECFRNSPQYLQDKILQEATATSAHLVADSSFWSIHPYAIIRRYRSSTADTAS